MKIFKIAILIFITVSCKKEAALKVDQNDFSRAYPLKIGNYWIYRSTTFYKNGFIQPFESTDSVWIDRDTIINRRLYWIRVSSMFGSQLITDSTGVILLKHNNEHIPIFSKRTYSDTLLKRPPFFRIMTDPNKEVTVVAGTFRTINCKTIMQMDEDGKMHDFPIHNLNFHTHEQTFFANDVGMVSRVTYFLGNRTEEDLQKYYIQH